MKEITYEEFERMKSELKTMSDVTNFAKRLIAPTIQSMLEAELDDHLGYPKNHPAGNLSGNNRNGHSSKTIKTSLGQAEINVPRDRNGSFEPVAVKKYESTESDLETKVIAMYAKGMTTRDINGYLHDIYGVNASADMISSITDKILPLAKEWQARPLAEKYALIYLDAVHFKVRHDGRIVSKAAYIALGINMDGLKEIVGIWVGENESSKFWLGVLTDMKRRGTQDILICSVDGLKGFPEAIKATFPDAEIQKCIVHQIRNTLKFIPHKIKKKFAANLKEIYRAGSEEEGLEALQNMKEAWPDYAIYLKSWEDNWSELSTFFVYPEEIRKIMYTTNPIESLNRQFRKVTKTTTIFPHNDSLFKLLFLAQRDISKKWNTPIRDWGKIYAQLVIFFPDRVKI